jgi:hypothetical protein
MSHRANTQRAGYFAPRLFLVGPRHVEGCDGYCDRWGYKFSVLKQPEGGVRYHVAMT